MECEEGWGREGAVKLTEIDLSGATWQFSSFPQVPTQRKIPTKLSELEYS